MKFSELDIIEPIMEALVEAGYDMPTPIQEEAIPAVMAGSDLLGCAQTGTGKTAAFAIPTLQLLNKNLSGRRNIRGLIVTPTRELALQIYENFVDYGKHLKLRSCVIFGGVSQKNQEVALKKGVDILIATPGRLNDLINQEIIDIRHVEIFILDEADRMLDMGFLYDIKKIISYIPKERQTLMFSATMPKDIERMANSILKNPKKIEISPASPTVELIQQKLYFVDKRNKKDLLLHILEEDEIVSALIFTRTKYGADRVARQLQKSKIKAQSIHGDKSQTARQRALNDFKDGKLRVLVATDIAARGIDIDELSHVINFELTDSAETYVHRIGRTGRAGLGGTAISFCDFDEIPQLKSIEKLIGRQIDEVKEHPYPLMDTFSTVKEPRPPRPPRSPRPSQRQRQSAGQSNYKKK